MAKWGTKNPPKKKGRYLVTIDTPFGNLSTIHGFVAWCYESMLVFNRNK